MAYYVKNDINYHGARSKTTVREQGKSKKQNSDAGNNNKAFPLQNGGSEDGWGTSTSDRVSKYDSDDIWGAVPNNSNAAEDGWEEERLVKGKSRRNRKFRPITDNDLIRISNQEVPDWSKADVEFPALGHSKPPVANVWEKRKEKYQEIQALQPTNETEEEFMIRKALELSKEAAMKEEEKRKHLEEEYKLQMHLMETNPLLFEEFRTDEELALAISKESAEIPEEGEWDCNIDGSTLAASNSKASKKDVHLEKNFMNSEEGIKNSASSKQKELQTSKKQQAVLPLIEQNVKVSSNTQNKPASQTMAISKASKAVNLFGGWGTSQKHSPPSKEVDISYNDYKSSTSKLDATKISKNNKTEVLKKNKATAIENIKASDTAVGVKSTSKNYEEEKSFKSENESLKQSPKSPTGNSNIFGQNNDKIRVNLKENETGCDISSNTDENITWISESMISHVKPENHIKTEIAKAQDCDTESSKNNIPVTVANFKTSDMFEAKQNAYEDYENMNKINLRNKTFERSSRNKVHDVTFTDQNSLDNVKTQTKHTEIECQMKKTDKDIGWKSENTILDELPMNHIKTNVKETLHFNGDVEDIKTGSDSLSSIISDYSELATKCDDILPKKNNQDVDKLVLNNNEETKSTNEVIFNILEKDYSCKDILNSALEDDLSLDSKKEFSSLPEILPPVSNCDSQAAVPKPNIPYNEISYSLKNLSPDSSKSHPFNENYTNSLLSNETLSIENTVLSPSSLSNKSENDISLPLFTTLRDDSNNDNLMTNNVSSTSIDPPKPPQGTNSFPEPLTAHFSSFPGPVPSNTFMMNPFMMHQMLIAYPFLWKQLQEMDGYYRSMGNPIGMGFPFCPQPVPTLAGTGVPVGQPSTTPMYDLPGGRHPATLNHPTESNSTHSFIDPPVPPPPQTSDFEGNNVSSEPPGIHPTFVLPETLNDTNYSGADNSWLDSILSREPQFDNAFIPPPTLPQSNVLNNIGERVHGVESMNKSEFNISHGNVANCDNNYMTNQPNKGMGSVSNNFALPNTYSLITSSDTLHSVQASSELDNGSGLKWNNITRPVPTEVPSSWHAGVNDWGPECQITNSMRNSSRYVLEKNSEIRQPARQPYLGRKKI